MTGASADGRAPGSASAPRARVRRATYPIDFDEAEASIQRLALLRRDQRDRGRAGSRQAMPHHGARQSTAAGRGRDEDHPDRCQRRTVLEQRTARQEATVARAMAEDATNLPDR